MSPSTPSAPRHVQQLHSLKGRCAVITGGSRGLGLQMAHALGEAGARVLITARKADELENAVQELRAAGIDAQCVAMDNGQEDQCIALAQRAVEQLGQVDILVNNAGTTWGAAAEDHPTASWDKVMNVNARGLFILTREIGKRTMIPRRQGRVINIASVAGLGGTRGSMQAIAYHASKGAVNTFTRALACEWGPYGITVNAILPGVFPTKMSAHLVTPETVAPLIQHLPLRRLGDDEGLKGPVLLFASDAGAYITGQLLAVDGGASAIVAD